ncbi:MAG: vWA domain-containing protein [Akkermansiaceae bacterium]
MSFAYPIVLIALAIPIILIVFQWRTHARALPLPLDHAQMKNWRFLDILLNLINTLPYLLLATLILLAAGPRTFERPESKRKLTNILFCLDVSGSMEASFGTSDRFGVAMDSLKGFLEYRDGDAFSLLIFGGDTLRWIPLTTDVSAFRNAPAFLHPKDLPPWFNQGTAIGKALRQGREELLVSETGDRMIILLSDGDSFDLRDGNDVKIARELEDDNITVYAIHIGGGGAPPEVSVISSITEGATFTAGDPEGLKSVFARIDEMAQASLERLTPDPVDNFKPYLITALSLGGVYLLTLYGLRYTPW